MSRSEVWLQLKPEFGGTAFGPLNTPEFRLGTADDNHVKLSEGLGVEAHHVRLVRRSEAAWLLAPVERSATVWLWRSGARQAVRFGHPSGTQRVGAEAENVDGQWVVRKAIMSRSARVLMEGWVRVPGDAF